MLFFLSVTPPAPLWWEPGTVGILDIGDISVFLAALIAFSTVIAMAGRWWAKQLRKIINEEITEATKPIHPNANGGTSLPDVARRSLSSENRLIKLEKAMSDVKSLLVELLGTGSIPIQEDPKTVETKKNIKPKK